MLAIPRADTLRALPELPDILVYLEALRPRVVGRAIERARIISPFVLRTFDPPIEQIEGKKVRGIERAGKRFIFDCDDELLVVVHLMIAGRWRYSKDPRAKPPPKITLASLVFADGALHLVESSKERRASIHIIRGCESLKHFDRGGLDVFTCTESDFAVRLRAENHTVKRSLTDPRFFDGIGNAYSDEILHAAKLSPVKLTSRLSDEEIARLLRATQATLHKWTQTLRAEFADKFPGPGDITAFRPDFAVHGKFGQPCPVCGTSVQRIRYADNETNYCPRCQTDGVILADRSLSRLLKKDWPRSIEQMESDQSSDQ